MHSTNPDLLRSCLYFRFSGVAFAPTLLIVRFHHSEIVVVKCLILGHSNEAWVGVEQLT